MMRGSKSFLPFMLAVSGGLAVIAAVVGFFTAGVNGALGAVAGVAFVAAVYSVSTIALTRVDTASRELMLVAAMGSYILKLILLIAVLSSLRAAGWEGMRPMAFGVAVAIAVWIVAQMWWLTRAKIPYVELPERK